MRGIVVVALAACGHGEHPASCVVDEVVDSPNVRRFGPFLAGVPDVCLRVDTTGYTFEADFTAITDATPGTTSPFTLALRTFEGEILSQGFDETVPTPATETKLQNFFPANEHFDVILEVRAKTDPAMTSISITMIDD